MPAFEDFRWADSIPLIVQSRLIQGFENAGDPRVGSDASGINGDFQLLVNIRKFELATIGEATAQVALMAKLMDAGGAVIDAKLFTADVPVSDIGKPEVIAAAIDQSFGKAATDLIVWTLGAMSDQEGSGAGGGADQNSGDAPSAQTPEPAPAADTAPATAQ